MHTHGHDDAQGLAALLEMIPTLGAGELARVREAVDGRARELAQSSVVERRPYRTGILQLEHRANPKTGTQRGPYWYFHYREMGRQRTLYVGVTDNPEAATDEKLAGARVGREKRGGTVDPDQRKS